MNFLTHPQHEPPLPHEMADDPVRSAGEIKNDARDDRLSGPMSLRHRERNHVRKQMAADARDKCWETRDAYVECARGVHFRARHALAFAMTSIVSPLRHRPDAQLAVHVPQRLQGVQHMPEPIVRPPHVETTLSSVLNSRLPRPFGSTTEAEFERRMAEFQPKNAVITPKDFYR